MYTAATRSLPKLAVWLKDCAMFAGEDRDWAMCHVGEKYQHLSLCSKGFRSLKETLMCLIIRSLTRTVGWHPCARCL